MRATVASWWLALMISCLAGCVSAPDRIAQTPSGRPEVIIQTGDVDLVKSEIINEMQTADFLLQDDSKYRLTFTKELDGDQAILAQLLIGNSYSTTPVGEWAFNLSASGNGIKVLGFGSISTQMAMGQVRRTDMKGNNAWFNAAYSLLERVKQKIEGREQANSVEPSEPGVPSMAVMDQ